MNHQTGMRVRMAIVVFVILCDSQQFGLPRLPPLVVLPMFLAFGLFVWIWDQGSLLGALGFATAATGGACLYFGVRLFTDMADSGLTVPLSVSTAVGALVIFGGVAVYGGIRALFAAEPRQRQ